MRNVQWKPLMQTQPSFKRLILVSVNGVAGFSGNAELRLFSPAPPGKIRKRKVFFFVFRHPGRFPGLFYDGLTGLSGREPVKVATVKRILAMLSGWLQEALSCSRSHRLRSGGLGPVPAILVCACGADPSSRLEACVMFGSPSNLLLQGRGQGPAPTAGGFCFAFTQGRVMDV